MKDSNDSKEESRIKQPKESAREEFQGSTAPETPQENEKPFISYKDTHTLITEVCYDGEEVYERGVYVPK